MYLGDEEESPSELIQVVGRIQFLEVGGLRAPFPCWLLIRWAIAALIGCSAVLAYGPLHLER